MKEYEEFILNWMIEHGHTIREMLVYMENYRNRCMDLNSPILDVFDMWAYEDGFGGEVWPCYEEWDEFENTQD